MDGHNGTLSLLHELYMSCEIVVSVYNYVFALCKDSIVIASETLHFIEVLTVPLSMAMR